MGSAQRGSAKITVTVVITELSRKTRQRRGAALEDQPSGRSERDTEPSGVLETKGPEGLYPRATKRETEVQAEKCETQATQSGTVHG